MSLDPAVLRALQSAGATTDMIIAAIEADAAKDEAKRAARREKSAERQRRKRVRDKGCNAESRVTSVTARDEALPSVTPPPNDIYSNPPPETSSTSVDGPLSAEIDQIVVEWNAMAGRTGLRKVVKLNSNRRKSLRGRLAEHGLARMLEAIGKIERSDFCRGKTGGTWMASFDFLVSDSRFLRLLEGNYDNPGVAKPSAPSNKPKTPAELDLQASFWESQGQPDKATELRRQAAEMRSGGSSGARQISDIVNSMNITAGGRG